LLSQRKTRKTCFELKDWCLRDARMMGIVRSATHVRWRFAYQRAISCV
jgi:hypothetical protein